MSVETSLLSAWPMPAGTTGLAIDVSVKHGKFVHIVVHYLGPRGAVLGRYVVRSGTHIWCPLLLPSVRAYCALLGLSCAVREVPRPKIRPSPRPNHVGRNR